MSKQISPLPWEVGYLDRNGQRVIKGEHIEIATCWHHSVGSIEKEMEANAAFIVKSVNSHDALKESLREALELLRLNGFHDEPADYGNGRADDIYNRGVKALSSAEAA